jgi:uncharacterized protein YjiS (DUF1127 family)
MKISALKRIIASATGTAIARFREIRRERRTRVALKDLSRHLLKDIGQSHYHERKELDHNQLGKSTDDFRS